MNKKIYEPFFKGKKITVMGLGVLGRGIQVTQFIAECRARLTVTDLKDKEKLKTSIKSLAKYKVRYVLGKHDMRDFENVDLVIKAAGVPLDSQYIRHARSKGIPVAMDASLFAKIVHDAKPPITIVGITGTRGKSMTTALIYHILKRNEKTLGGRVYLGGNMRKHATLPILKKVAPGDYAVLELDSWQCQGFGDEHISPHVAVFTNLLSDHMNYYKGSVEKYFKDKMNIYRFQNTNDILITNKKLLKKLTVRPKGRVILPDTSKVRDISMKIFGTHNNQNAAYAYEVASALGIGDIDIRKALEAFPGLEGRLEYLGKKKGIHVINDNNATTPEATTAGIEAMRRDFNGSNLILICGGMDKGLDLSSLTDHIKKFCKKVVLLPGTGTERLKKKLHNDYIEAVSLISAVNEAYEVADKNDLILFSPGFASFGLFTNEYDRNDQFLKIINKM